MKSESPEKLGNLKISKDLPSFPEEITSRKERKVIKANSVISADQLTHRKETL